MSKIAVVYWSGTGNTEAMAAAVVEGAKEKGAEVSLLTASEFSPEQVSEYDAIAFGCPSMGSEQLEESEFEDGANLACESVICNEAPDEEALSACRALGAALA